METNKEIEIGLVRLRVQKRAYVKEKADQIIAEMVRRNITTDTLSTCDHSNWDRELHSNMNDIATELRSRGLSVRSSVNFGVTDWVFTVNT